MCSYVVGCLFGRLALKENGAISEAVGVEPSEDSHAYVLVLELCEGETLDLRLKMSGPMLEKERALRMEELVLEGEKPRKNISQNISND